MDNRKVNSKTHYKRSLKKMDCYYILLLVFY